MRILYSIALLMTIGALLLSTSAASADGGDVIEGRVYEKAWTYQAQDAPLPGVDVHLQSLDQGPEPVTVAVMATDGQGRYSFAMNQYPLGSYRILLPDLAAVVPYDYAVHVVIENGDPKPTEPDEELRPASGPIASDPAPGPTETSDFPISRRMP